MHLGKAIIVTDSLGVSDYARDGENAILVPPKDPQMMSRGIEMLLDNPALIEQLGLAGERFAQTNCSESSTVQYLRRVLYQIQL